MARMILKYRRNPEYWERFFGREEIRDEQREKAEELQRLANLPDDQNPGIQITYHP